MATAEFVIIVEMVDPEPQLPVFRAECRACAHAPARFALPHRLPNLVNCHLRQHFIVGSRRLVDLSILGPFTAGVLVQRPRKGRGKVLQLLALSGSPPGVEICLIVVCRAFIDILEVVRKDLPG